MAASATASATSSSEIFSVNPYESHPSLTQIEADVLWEYAKLNQHIKDVRTYHTP
jgi:DASH complex subunit DAD3